MGLLTGTGIARAVIHSARSCGMKSVKVRLTRWSATVRRHPIDRSALSAAPDGLHPDRRPLHSG
jgi:hypothetical protein